MNEIAASSPQVLISGAGPAGLALACALHDRGLAVTVLEQADPAVLAAPPVLSRRSSTSILRSRAYPILHHMGE